MRRSINRVTPPKTKEEKMAKKTRKTGADRLVGKDLKGFKILWLLKILDFTKGPNAVVLGYINNPKIAKLFVAVKRRPDKYAIKPVMVLTNGKIAYEIFMDNRGKVFNDQEETRRLRGKKVRTPSASHPPRTEGMAETQAFAMANA